MKQKLAILISMMVLVVPGVSVSAEEYPAKPITALIGYTPGGATDMPVRALAERAGKTLGQPVICLNKPGGGTVIAITALKNSPPDGYTIGVLSTASIIAPYIQSVPPYNLLKDFAPIMQFGLYQFGLVVRTEAPWKSFKEFFEYAQANPGKIKYGTAGAASPQNILMGRLAAEYNINWKGIHFPGGAQAHFNLLGGHVDAIIQITESREHVKSGALRLLAGFGEKRMADFPEVPTVKEMGYKYTTPSIIALIAPRGVPEPILQKLDNTFREAMSSEEFLKVMKQTGQPIEYRNRKQLAEHVQAMDSEYASVVKKLGIKDTAK
jgi:tripartite-type tricarboxylate transporter receptor subunit TctC